MLASGHSSNPSMIKYVVVKSFETDRKASSSFARGGVRFLSR